MFPPETFRPLLEAFTELLRTNQIRFALTGGIASSYYGEPRYTQDIDILVDRVRLIEILTSVADEFQKAGYLTDRSRLADAVKAGRSFQLVHVVECLKLDIYPRELVPGELTRAVTVEVFPGVHLPIVSLPDLAISKLVWISRGSHKNRRDLRQLVRRMSAIEVQLVRTAATERSLDVLLDEVLVEPDEFNE
ncbi:MAG TPA: nucleotidyl transferase AbiEii/AbiGii toxin family protein [Caulifigura sp.]|nr:nucleotidyl transferase AbiEii/AbiGii toxin family protein [Caulifigura sp.]